MPLPGVRIHCHTRPVATNDIAYGYKNTVRSTPSPVTFWSMNTASKKPMRRQARMNSTPYRARLCSDSSQRSFSNRRVYWLMPTKVSEGKLRELVSEVLNDHNTVPR